MTDMRQFGNLRDKALLEREEGLAEGVAELREAPLDRRVDFLRNVPSAKGALVEDLLADIRNLQEGRGLGEMNGGKEVTPKASIRRGGMFVGLLLGMIAGAVGGAGSAWVILDGDRETAPPMPVMVQMPTPIPTPISRWASSEEEEFYLRLSRSNGGIALEAHCQGDGKVEVETMGGRRNACLAWPPSEGRWDEGPSRP